MKYIPIVSFFMVCTILSVSCEQTECCGPPLQLSGRFVHEVPDCDNEGNPEINCSEWLDFINDTKVSVLYGGGDIAFQFDYIINGNILTLQQDPLSSFAIPFDFKIIDPQTLERSDNGDLWIKSF